MPWIYRDADQHVCSLPILDKKSKIGDTWKCDECKVAYTVHRHFDRTPYLMRSTQEEIDWAQSQANIGGS